MDKEIWKDLNFVYKEVNYDYTNIYQVSNFGRIKSLERLNLKGILLKEKILKPSIEKGGYRKVKLFDKNGNSKQHKVHVLVAIMFVPNPENKQFVDHIIPIRNGGTDFSDNLRWVTSLENANNPNTIKNLTGKKRTEETIRKMKDNHKGMTGKKHKEETINNMKINRIKHRYIVAIKNEIILYLDLLNDDLNKYNLKKRGILICCRYNHDPKKFIEKNDYKYEFTNGWKCYYKEDYEVMYDVR